MFLQVAPARRVHSVFQEMSAIVASNVLSQSLQVGIVQGTLIASLGISATATLHAEHRRALVVLVELQEIVRWVLSVMVARNVLLQ